MQAYLDLLQDILVTGKVKPNRTGVDTIYKFVTNFRHDLRDGFPLLTTKKVNPLTPLAEMFAFFRGEDNLQGFHDLDCKIWDEWGLKTDYLRRTPLTLEETAEHVAAKFGYDQVTALAELRSVQDKYGQYHSALRDMIAQFASEEKINDYMANNPEPPSYNAWLMANGIPTYKDIVVQKRGDLGPIYGVQWTKWKTSDGRTINQLKDLVEAIGTSPTSRRLVLTGWNPEVVPPAKLNFHPNGDFVLNSSDGIQASIKHGFQALPPCHLLTIFDVDVSGPTPVLNLHQTMRSSDVPIGLPFNIAGYAYFLAIVAKQLGMIAGELVITSTNAHVYSNQAELALMQVTRTPSKLPTLTIPDGIDVTKPETLTLENARRIVDGLEGYAPQGFIKYPVEV